MPDTVSIATGIVRRTRWPVAMLLASLVIPWINPFVFGPLPSMVSWQVSAACVVVVLMLYCSSASRRDGNFLGDLSAVAWLIAALISCVFGLLQYFGHTDPFGPLVNQGNLGDAYANLRQRNQFATLTNIGLAVVLFSRWIIDNASQRAWKVGTIAAMALIEAGTAASNSRTGMVQLLLLVGLGLIWRRSRRLVALALILYAAATVLLPTLLGAEFFQSGILARLRESNAPCSSRVTLWGNVLHLISQKPWFGWGWGELDYAHFITLYPDERFCEILDNAHNLPLHLAVELGVPFAALFCAACVHGLLKLKPWQETEPNRQVSWAVLAVIGFHSLVEYPLWYGPFQIATILCIVQLWLSRQGRRRASPDTSHGDTIDALPARSSTGRLALNVIVLSLTAALAYTAWDYHRISQIYLAPNQRDKAYQDETMQKIQDSWLFRNAVRFAQLTTTAINANNAAAMGELAKELLHFSPEPRVVQIVIEGAIASGNEEEALFYLQRFKAAFPAEHAKWAQTNQKVLSALKAP